MSCTTTASSTNSLAWTNERGPATTSKDALAGLPHPDTQQRGASTMTVRRPTLEQMMEIVDSFGMSMTPERVGEFLSLMEGNFAAYDLIDQMPDEVPVVKYPRTPGYRPKAEENPLNAWYVKTDIEGAPARQAQRQDGRGQGQCLRRRRADDERLLDARRLRAQYRRDHRHAPPRRRRDHQGKGALRIVLPFRRQPYRGAWGRCTTLTNAAIPPAAPPRGAARWSRPARSIWRSAATRADRSACRPPSAASMA